MITKKRAGNKILLLFHAVLIALSFGCSSRKIHPVYQRWSPSFSSSERKWNYFMQENYPRWHPLPRQKENNLFREGNKITSQKQSLEFPQQSPQHKHYDRKNVKRLELPEPIIDFDEISSPSEMQDYQIVPDTADFSDSSSSSNTYHIVSKGETLFSIARKKYGNASFWKKIYHSNKDNLSNPNELKPGMRLLLP